MIRGYFQVRYDRMCDSVYLIDRDRKLAYTLEVKVHKQEQQFEAPSSDFSDHSESMPQELLRAIAEALQQGGYIPKSAVDAELSATKFHLEDMRKLALK